VFNRENVERERLSKAKRIVEGGPKKKKAPNSFDEEKSRLLVREGIVILNNLALELTEQYEGHKGLGGRQARAGAGEELFRRLTT